MSLEDFTKTCTRNADSDEYQRKVQLLFGTSVDGVIGLRLNLVQSSERKGQELQKLESVEQIIEYLKDQSRFELYLRNDDDDENERDETISNGLCLIDTFKRIMEFHGTKKVPPKTDFQVDYEKFAEFLKELIKNASEQSDRATPEINEVLQKMLEFTNSMDDEMNIDGKKIGMFTPFPNDDVIRMLFPEVLRILLQEPIGLPTDEKFDHLVSINNVKRTGCFSYKQIYDILGKEELLVFKLKDLHYWASLSVKAWKIQAQEKLSEALENLAEQVKDLNDNSSNIKVTLSDAIDKITMLLTTGEDYILTRLLILDNNEVGCRSVESIGPTFAKIDVDTYICNASNIPEIVAEENNADSGDTTYTNFDRSVEYIESLQQNIQECVQKACEVMKCTVDPQESVAKLKKHLVDNEIQLLSEVDETEYDADYDNDDDNDDSDDDDNDDDYDGDEEDDDSNVDDADNVDDGDDDAAADKASKTKINVAFYLYAYFCDEDTVKVCIRSYYTNLFMVI